MTNAALWKRVLEFEFDMHTDVYGFSLRLAKENSWTRNFTARAIEEYRRFMYLAAISEEMVSPSAIVDQVWHLHLIYTRSYDDFCNLLGKKVQHIPATHNPTEGNRYVQARNRTMVLYTTEFGAAPEEIWSAAGMLEFLELPKARVKLGAAVAYGLIGTGALIFPLYFLLRPFYAQINPGNFITGYFLLVIFAVIVLQTINRSRLSNLVSRFRKNAFTERLHPMELVYLKNNRVDSIVNGYLNHLTEYQYIRLHSNSTIEAVKSDDLFLQEESQILQLLSSTGKMRYDHFMRKIVTRNVFSNAALSMDALMKYILKSAAFHRIFYINFAIYALLFLLGLERVVIGVMRDKPVVYISIIVVVIAALSAFMLYRLTTQLFTRIIPRAYEQRIKTDSWTHVDWQWKYFLLGSAVFSLSFAQMANRSLTESMQDFSHSGSKNNGGSCGSSCGGNSSCGGGGGSSCGGGSCGGCGGGGD